MPIAANLPLLELDQTQFFTHRLLLYAAAVVFVEEAALDISVSQATLLYFAKIEADFATQVAASIFGGKIENVKKQSRPRIEWAILRSTRTPFTTVLGKRNWIRSLSLAGNHYFRIFGSHGLSRCFRRTSLLIDHPCDCYPGSHLNHYLSGYPLAIY